MKQSTPNYGNWIPEKLLLRGWLVTFGLLLAAFGLWKFTSIPVLSAIILVLGIFMLLMCIYMQICHHAFSFQGKNVMGAIHKELLSHLSWNGIGHLLDIGCGSGALSIRCAKAFPTAQITGLDYWGKEWNYAKQQCEQNAAMESVNTITFLQGDAASLPFANDTFDAAVSNFVFHEVKTQPDKRQVVREALRIVKPGGCFVFHDLFEQKAIYGNIQEFITQLKKEGIREVHYIPHTEKLPCIPSYVKAPWLLSNMGILYGIK